MGQSLTLPPAASQHHKQSTHKVMDGRDWIGNTSATTPMPPTPPQPPQNHHSPWKVMALIAVAIVATVTITLTAGTAALYWSANYGALGALGASMQAGLSVLGGGAVLGTTLSTAAVMTIGFAAGFVGSVAAQGAATLLKLQEHIDLKGALISGLATAATAGLQASRIYTSLANAAKNVPSEYFNLVSATEMMERDVLSQGINLAVRDHQHFDWLSLGTSVAAAGVMGSTHGMEFNDNLQKNLGKGAGSFLSSELQGLATGSTSSAAGGHFDAAQVVSDSLGSAIGSTLVQQGAEKGLADAMEQKAFNDMMGAAATRGVLSAEERVFESSEDGLKRLQREHALYRLGNYGVTDALN